MVNVKTRDTAESPDKSTETTTTTETQIQTPKFQTRFSEKNNKCDD